MPPRLPGLPRPFVPRLPPSATVRLMLAAVVLAGVPWPRAAVAAPGRPVSVRVTWGGGKPHAWSGSIRVVNAEADVGPAAELDWQTLSTDPDAAATVHAVGGAILVHEPSRRGGNGVEITLPHWRGARIAVRLQPDGDERAVVAFEAPVADFLVEPVQQPLDKDGNRLTMKATPGDALRVASVVSAAAPSARSTTLFRPGETLRLTVEPLLPRRSSGPAPVELRMWLKVAGESEPLAAESLPLTESAPADAEPSVEPRLQEYESVRFEVPLPAREAAYDIELAAVERGGLRWSRPLATRTVQVAAVAAAPPEDTLAEPARADDWKIVHELDPGSPRLHERLRRLPAVGRSYVPPLPSLPLPSVPLPNVGMPNVSLPHVPLPNVPKPKLPGVSLPSVAGMVPRLGGLLATGHSTVEPHPLGPMLRLPPARSADEPSWEGIVIAGAQPGMPHLVEVEFPADQRAVVALAVLESDAAGAAVELRAASGFEVTPVEPEAAAAAPSRHAFVFRPTTNHPLLVIANPSVRWGAFFGRVRVSAGPLRPAGPALGFTARGTAAGRGGRQVHAFVPSADLTWFGGAKRAASGSGRCFADWQTFLAGATHATEWLSAQGAAGAMWVVYRDGAAVWPSRLTRSAARWDPGAAADAGLDPVRKDLLGLLCRTHGRQGLHLLPALCFDAPLPALESLVATGGPLAAGIVCTGPDGKPRETDGGRGWHYNVLDPRVQQAVEEVVRELADRLRGEDAVGGVALVMPHDGWMHLPGTASCLDDTTFSRFLVEMGATEPAGAGDRFARRAALVEGPLRQQWLEWRSARVARFHSRLAEILAEQSPRWSLHVVPTTLFAEGPLAARFRPALAAGPATTDVWRQIGLDPARITADSRIVFVTPHVHAAADTLLDQSIIAEANRSLEMARGAAAAARRGVVAVERPVMLSVADVVPHGPFSGARPSLDAVPVAAVAVGPARARALAEALVSADVEVFFDMGLISGRPDRSYESCLRAFAGLPPASLELTEDLAAPLVIRTGREQSHTVVSLVNAGPVPCRAALALEGVASAVIDAVDAARLPLEPGGGAVVPLAPWAVRTLVLDGGVGVRAARAEFDDRVRGSIEARLADLARRRAALEAPRPLDVLDNPGFELQGPAGAGGAGGVAGWELVEAGRGTIATVPGADGGGGRAIAFSSQNGLSTLRSNPFSPPATGRVSVAVWLRIGDGDPQPPLRVAVEGMLDGREYYRFAPVGGLAGGKPLAPAWSQFVLQVDDLPARGLESLRVRFDLLGPGGAQIDGVRVFDLAFDESQRVQLSRRLAVVEERLAAGDLGACLLALDGHWPRFLAEFVTDEAVAASVVAGHKGVGGSAPPVVPPPAERSGSVFDRVRRWWQ